MFSSLPKSVLLLVPAILSASSITLSSSANPAVYGHAVTLTAVVTPSTATGKVTFYDGTLLLETTSVAGGKTSYTTTLLGSGARSLRAYYGGDSKNPASSSPVIVQQVNTVPGTGFKLNSAKNPVPYSDPFTTTLIAADLNGDGYADLVVAGDNDSGTNTGTVSILLGNGDGSFQPAVNYSFGAAAITTEVVADFNGDGKPDLFVVSASSPVTAGIFFGNGNGTFQAPVNLAGFDILDPESYGCVLVVGDFNGDGKADLVVSGMDASVREFEAVIALGNGDGTFQAPSIVYSTTVVDIAAVSVGDINGDGKADLVISIGDGFDTSAVVTLLGNGDGTFQIGGTISNLEGWFTGSAIGDLNGDGKADLVLLGTTTLAEFGYSLAFLGNGDGTFQAPNDIGDAGAAGDAAIVDINGDGKPDLVYESYFLEVSILLGNGDGTFQPSVNYGNPDGTQVAVADFNGDGRADIAAADTDSIDILISAAFVSTVTQLSSSFNPSTFAQNVTLTAQVSPATATGTVAFYDGSILLGSSTLNAGLATLSTSALSAGNDSLTAVYSGDTFDAASSSSVLTQTVLKATTSVTMTSSPNPSVFRGVVTLTANVASPAGAGGTVTFYRGATSLGIAGLSAGVAVLNTGTLPLGSNALTANYNGDANDDSSASSTHIQLVRDSTAVTLTSSPNPSSLNQAVLFTATVTPAGAKGQVTFYVGSTSIGSSSLSGGIASLSVSGLKAGKHEVTASYAGNLSYGPNQSPVLLQVVQ